MRATPDGPRCMVPNPDTGTVCMRSTSRPHVAPHNDFEGTEWPVHPDPKPWRVDPEDRMVKGPHRFARKADGYSNAVIVYDPRPIYEMGAASLAEMLLDALDAEEDRHRVFLREIAQIRDALAVAKLREDGIAIQAEDVARAFLDAYHEQPVFDSLYDMGDESTPRTRALTAAEAVIALTRERKKS